MVCQEEMVQFQPHKQNLGLGSLSQAMSLPLLVQNLRQNNCLLLEKVEKGKSNLGAKVANNGSRNVIHRRT